MVYCTTGREVSDVWVQGQRIVAEGRVTTIESEGLFRQVRQLARYLARASGLGDYSLLARPDG